MTVTGTGFTGATVKVFLRDVNGVLDDVEIATADITQPTSDTSFTFVAPALPVG